MGARGPAATAPASAPATAPEKRVILLLVIRQPTPRDLPSVPRDGGVEPPTSGFAVESPFLSDSSAVTSFGERLCLECGYEASCAATATMAWPRAGASHAFAASIRGAVLPTFHVPMYTDILCAGDPSSPSVSRASSAGPADLAFASLDSVVTGAHASALAMRAFPSRDAGDRGDRSSGDVRLDDPSSSSPMAPSPTPLASVVRAKRVVVTSVCLFRAWLPFVPKSKRISGDLAVLARGSSTFLEAPASEWIDSQLGTHFDVYSYFMIYLV